MRHPHLSMQEMQQLRRETKSRNMCSILAFTRKNTFTPITHPSLAIFSFLFILLSSLSVHINASALSYLAAEKNHRLSAPAANTDWRHQIFAPFAILAHTELGNSILLVGTSVDDKSASRRRNLLEQNVNSLPIRHDRIDPLHGFKKYVGGYNLKSKHYWASVVFTGIYGYAIGAALLVLGLVLALVLCIFWCRRRLSKRWKRDGTPKVTTSWILLFIISFLIIVSLVFCCVALPGDQRIDHELKKVKDTIVDSADSATNTIYNVTSTITEIGNILLAYDQGSSLSQFNSTTESLNSAANIVQHKVSEFKRRFNPILHTVYIIVFVLTSVAIFILILTAVCTLLHRKRRYWRQLFIASLVILWIITIIIWVIFGGAYTIHSFVDDTCIALVEFESDPYNNTLDTIIPCIDLKTANDAVIQVREAMYDFISQANQNISAIQQDFPNNKQIDSLPHICNPFSGPPDYNRDVICGNDTVPIGDVPTVLQPFKCSGNDSQECISSEGRYITDSNFMEIIAFTTAAQRLLDITPSLETLTNCSFVEDAFSTIVNERCHPLKSAIHITWVAYVGLGTTSILLLMFSIIELYNTRQAHSYVKGGVVPHNTLTPPSDVGDKHTIVV